jgi:hypothetical protein
MLNKNRLQKVVGLFKTGFLVCPTKVETPIYDNIRELVTWSAKSIE